MKRLTAWLDRVFDTWLDPILFTIGLCTAVTSAVTVLALAWIGLFNLIA